MGGVLRKNKAMVNTLRLSAAGQVLPTVVVTTALLLLASAYMVRESVITARATALMNNEHHIVAFLDRLEQARPKIQEAINNCMTGSTRDECTRGRADIIAHLKDDGTKLKLNWEPIVEELCEGSPCIFKKGAAISGSLRVGKIESIRIRKDKDGFKDDYATAQKECRNFSEFSEALDNHHKKKGAGRWHVLKIGFKVDGAAFKWNYRSYCAAFLMKNKDAKSDPTKPIVSNGNPVGPKTFCEHNIAFEIRRYLETGHNFSTALQSDPRIVHIMDKVGRHAADFSCNDSDFKKTTQVCCGSTNKKLVATGGIAKTVKEALEIKSTKISSKISALVGSEAVSCYLNGMKYELPTSEHCLDANDENVQLSLVYKNRSGQCVPYYVGESADQGGAEGSIVTAGTFSLLPGGGFSPHPLTGGPKCPEGFTPKQVRPPEDQDPGEGVETRRVFECQKFQSSYVATNVKVNALERLVSELQLDANLTCSDKADRDKVARHFASSPIAAGVLDPDKDVMGCPRKEKGDESACKPCTCGDAACIAGRSACDDGKPCPSESECLSCSGMTAAYFSGICTGSSRHADCPKSGSCACEDPICNPDPSVGGNLGHIVCARSCLCKNHIAWQEFCARSNNASEPVCSEKGFCQPCDTEVCRQEPEHKVCEPRDSSEKSCGLNCNNEDCQNNPYDPRCPDGPWGCECDFCVDPKNYKHPVCRGVTCCNYNKDDPLTPVNPPEVSAFCKESDNHLNSPRCMDCVCAQEACKNFLPVKNELDNFKDACAECWSCDAKKDKLNDYDEISCLDLQGESRSECNEKRRKNEWEHDLRPDSGPESYNKNVSKDIKASVKPTPRRPIDNTSRSKYMCPTCQDSRCYDYTDVTDASDYDSACPLNTDGTPFCVSLPTEPEKCCDPSDPNYIKGTAEGKMRCFPERHCNCHREDCKDPTVNVMSLHSSGWTDEAKEACKKCWSCDGGLIAGSHTDNVTLLTLTTRNLGTETKTVRDWVNYKREINEWEYEDRYKKWGKLKEAITFAYPIDPADEDKRKYWCPTCAHKFKDGKKCFSKEGKRHEDCPTNAVGRALVP